MNVVDKAKAIIDSGIKGKTLSIPTRIRTLDQCIHGTRQGCYYLYGGETGAGKTTFVRENHIHVPYEYYKQINNPEEMDVQFIDFSLEIAGELNILSAISRKIFIDYGKIIPVERLTRWNQKAAKLSEDDLKLVESYYNYFREFSDKLFIVDEETTPTLFHDVLMETAKKNGTFSKEGRWISECGEYTPNNPNLYTIVVVDTVNLADMDSGHEFVKSSIDRISRLGVWFRNKCNFTPIIIQQFGAGMNDTNRKRFGVPTPILSDFEDSKRTTKDANIVLGLYDPQIHLKETESNDFRGYDITILKSWFRALYILKNRNGQSNWMIALKFDGATGTFTQLPDVVDMNSDEYIRATRH